MEEKPDVSLRVWAEALPNLAMGIGCLALAWFLNFRLAAMLVLAMFGIRHLAVFVLWPWLRIWKKEVAGDGGVTPNKSLHPTAAASSVMDSQSCGG